MKPGIQIPKPSVQIGESRNITISEPTNILGRESYRGSYYFRVSGAGLACMNGVREIASAKDITQALKRLIACMGGKKAKVQIKEITKEQYNDERKKNTQKHVQNFK